MLLWSGGSVKEKQEWCGCVLHVSWQWMDTNLMANGIQCTCSESCSWVWPHEATPTLWILSLTSSISCYEYLGNRHLSSGPRRMSIPLMDTWPMMYTWLHGYIYMFSGAKFITLPSHHCPPPNVHKKGLKCVYHHKKKSYKTKVQIYLKWQWSSSFQTSRNTNGGTASVSLQATLNFPPPPFYLVYNCFSAAAIAHINTATVFWLVIDVMEYLVQ